MSNASATAYQADGLDQGSTDSVMDCHNYTPQSIAADYSAQLGLFESLFPSTYPIRTNRTHCIVWSDYATQPSVELKRGIRLDTNYSGLSFFTGSGMPMRFADTTGAPIDVYQAATQLDGALGESDPAAIDALLAKAVGPEGYTARSTRNAGGLGVFPHLRSIVASAGARRARDCRPPAWTGGWPNESSFQALT